MENNVYKQTYLAISELYEKAKLKENSVIIVGCSTSEVVGSKIGTNSSYETATEIFSALNDFSNEKNVRLAIQCCEHLNRAVITERKTILGAEIVNVIPQPKAGGSLATVAYKTFTDPVAVEDIKADAGLDIGLTLIGMHLKKVAVPVRLENNKIGSAIVVGARTRPKFVGGSRAVYDENLL